MSKIKITESQLKRVVKSLNESKVVKESKKPVVKTKKVEELPQVNESLEQLKSTFKRFI